MAKSTRTNPASRGSLTLVQEAASDEVYEPVPARRSARDSYTDAPSAEEAQPRLRPFRSGEGVMDEEPFLRGRRRVRVRRGIFPSWSRTRWGKVLFLLLALAVLAAGIALAFAIRGFFLHNPQFQISSTSSIQTVGNHEVSRASILSVFGSDIGRNVFLVPLARRRAEVESLPWVKSAAVMRVLPNHLRVSIVERKPVAFLRTGSSISLIDAAGKVLNLEPSDMAKQHFSFPVITGLDPAMPRQQRAARVGLYLKFMKALSQTGQQITSRISEVNLSDPEDLRATITTDHHDLLLHFGHQDFLARYHRYSSNIQNWLSKYPALSAVDLRYNDQVVLTMAHSGSAGQAGRKAGITAAQPHKQRGATAHRSRP